MKLRPIRSLLLLFMVLGMAGCASLQPVHDFQSGKKMLSEGRLEQGLGKLQLAAQADPENVKYQQY